MPRVLPAALGAVETTVMREAGAYASIAIGGREVVPTLIDSVQDPDGHVVMRASGLECGDCSDASSPPVVTDNRPQIADPDSDFQLITMMQGVVQRGTGSELRWPLGVAIVGGLPLLPALVNSLLLSTRQRPDLCPSPRALPHQKIASASLESEPAPVRTSLG